jgi:hypothetical protein
MSLIIIKTVVSITVVLLLVFVSERNPGLGGLLAGLPIGAGMMVFFYGTEQGVGFAVQGIPYGISGLTSSLSFAVGFYIGGKNFMDRPLFHVAVASLSGLTAFFIVGYLISIFKIDLVASLLIFAAGVIPVVAFFRNIPVKRKSIPKKLNFLTVLFRTLFVAAVVLLVTGIAKIIGHRWSGIMASFPTGLCPLLMILAYSYKDELYPVVLSSFSFSVTTLVVFYLSVSVLFPSTGVFCGTLIAYVICLAYLYLLHKIKLKMFPIRNAVKR